jgi:regulator of sigma E protease
MTQLSTVLFDFILPFLLAMGVLVVIHEFGHYLVARWCGVKVLRFSIGFGRALAAKRLGKDQTEWAIGIFPLGGYVKMLDEREEPVAAAEVHRAFNRQSVAKRIAIVLAGPVANFLLAIVAYWGLHLAGVPGVKAVVAQPVQASAAAAAGIGADEEILSVAGQPVATWERFSWAMLERAVERGVVTLQTRDAAGQSHTRELNLSAVGAEDLEGDFLSKLGLVPMALAAPPVIGEIVKGGAAEKAGLQAQDRVLSVNGVPVPHWPAFAQSISKRAGQKVELRVQRHGSEIAVSVVPETVVVDGKQVGRINAKGKANDAQYERYETKYRYGPVSALGAAVVKTWDVSAFSVKMLAKMVTGQLSLRNLSGPITIADYAGQSVKRGGKSFFNFIALVSISLGILNLLPIPLLDGGHLMYYIAEAIKGRPVSDRFMELGQQIGMALLLALMLIAFYNDISRQLSG